MKIQINLAVARYKDNRNRSGVYCWVNKENVNTYVGSSQNLGKRFTQYFNYTHLVDTMRHLSINKALLKYGYSNFSLDILEYCDISVLLERELYYLDLLKPAYNILLKTGSSLGLKHSEKTLAKLIGPKSPEHLEKIIDHLAKLNSSPVSD